MGIIRVFKNKYKYVILFLFLIFISSTCQFYKINRSLDNYHEFATADQMLFSGNLLKYGLTATKGGQVNNINPLTGNFLYYTYHPPFATYVYALSFRIFGLSVLAGRLTSMFWFYLGVIILYILVSKIWDKKIALLTSFFYVFFPLSQYFGKIVFRDIILMPFIYLFIYFYYLWITKRTQNYFYLMLATLFLACLTDWPAYCLAPLIIIHFCWMLKNKDKRIFLLLIIEAFTLGVFLLHNYFLTGSFAGTQSQWPAYLGGKILGVFEHGISARLRWGILWSYSFYFRFLEYFLYSFTLTAILLIFYFCRKFNNFSKYTFYIFVPSTPFLYGIIFPGVSFDHMFYHFYLAATIAIICALAVSKFSKKFLILFCAVFLIFSVMNINVLYKMNNTSQDALMLGKIIPTISSPQEGVALSEPFYWPFIEYFGERKILYDVNNWERLSYIFTSGKVRYFITNFKDFQEYLIKRFPAVSLPDSFVLFDFFSQKK